jgi:hypothetical protein
MGIVTEGKTKPWEYRQFLFNELCLMTGLDRIGADGWSAFQIEQDWRGFRVYAKRKQARD